MRTICSMIATIALVFLAAPAVAMEWVYVGKTADDDRFYYDLDTVQRVGDRIVVWERVYPTRVPIVDKNGNVEEVRTRRRYDCDKKTSAELAVSLVFSDKIQTRYIRSPDQKETSINPGSLLAETFLAVCSTTHVFEGNWIKFHTTDSGTDIYYHAKKLQRPEGLSPTALGQSGILTVWLKYDHTRDNTVKYRETRKRDAYSCGVFNNVRTITRTIFYADGQTDPLQSSLDLREDPKPVYSRTRAGTIVVLDPVADKIMKMFCPKRSVAP